ncbi:MAG: adenine deaminase [Candidatus Acidiferrales bacterium]
MTLGNSDDFATRIRQAMGREPADLVIKRVMLLDVVTGELTPSDIAITDHTISGTLSEYNGRTEIDGKGLTAVPGFIDTHVHVESSMITPMEFDRCVLPRGTTTAVCDPHEIANVLGEAALAYFQKCAENTVMDLMVQLSSCVPASPLETSGARLDAASLKKFADHPKTIGLAEFMDIGGVLTLNPATLEKLAAFESESIDGHLPGIRGYALNAMAACGIRNCHESTDLAQAEEKLRKGVQVFIREGTICKDLKALVSLVTTRLSPFLGFCTDDRNPLEIAREGHIDYLVRTAIRLGADPRDVYRVASWSAAQGFGLHKNTPKWQARGLIAPGYKADIVLLSDLQTCTIHSVIKNGRVVTPELFDRRARIEPVGYNSVKNRSVTTADFAVHLSDGAKGEQDVIGIIPGQIVTKHLRFRLPQNSAGEWQRDLENDILKLAVVERHGKNGHIGVGFVKGFGFREGAIASSVGHDSHNISVVGATDKDMAAAVNRIRENQGGYVVARNGKILGEVALPIAGLMSDRSFESVAQDLQRLREATHQLGSAIEDPMMILAFLSLCVVPALKLTDFGLVRFAPPQDESPVLIHDQRSLHGHPA